MIQTILQQIDELQRDLASVDPHGDTASVTDAVAKIAEDLRRACALNMTLERRAQAVDKKTKAA